MKRRDFLKGALGGTAALGLGPLVTTGCGVSPPPPDSWDAGPVLHLLPTANHERIRLKASFARPFDPPPRLVLPGRRIPGERTDSGGRFFAFDARGLEPGTEYTLQLESEAGERLCDPWPLRTFPAPDATPERFRLLAYTCAGGPELYNFGFFDAFLPVASRQRLLARALSFRPDAVVANGDHVYWDLATSRWQGNSPRFVWAAGRFDRSQPILGSENEAVLVRAFGPQIAALYGVRFRSVPTFFLQDDHDYGENDEASEALRSFPPDAFMLDLGRTTQRLYYPEFLDAPALPRRYVRKDRTAESFGELRYGRLFEGLLYDCRRYLSNSDDPGRRDPDSRFVPRDAERWLLDRTARSNAVHLAHLPSTPVLWSAGKWGEWYPDVHDANGELGVRDPKPFWPEGWGAQHDLLLRVASRRTDRLPLFVSGDLHALGAGRILATRDESLEANPVVSVLTGPIGTGPLGWPSVFRGQLPIPSATVRAEEWLAPLEENGFSLLDFTPDGVVVSLFRWTPKDGEDALDTLEPFRVLELEKPRRRG